MSIDITQQALNALADAGLGNDSPAEAYVIGYTPVSYTHLTLPTICSV